MSKAPKRVTLRAAAALVVWSLVAGVLVAPASQVGAVVGTPDALATTASVCEEADLAREVFDDVPVAYVHALNIDCVAFYNISKGSGAGNLFAPERQVTRWEMALFLARTADLVGVLLPSGSSASFDDLEGLPSEATDAIGSLAAAGIIKGRSDQTFDPYSVVARGQSALLLVRFLSLVATSGVSVGADGEVLINGNAPDDFFDDVRGRFPNEFDVATGALFELGITTGVSGAQFRPGAAVTRAQMASFLARMFDHTTLVSDAPVVAAPPPAGPVTPPPADLRPSFSGSPTVFVWIAGTEVDATLPSAVGGDPPLTYSLAATPDLPTGLSYIPTDNKITGTAPSGAIPEESYTLNVVDVDGDTASTEVRITIEEDVAPQFDQNNSSVEFGTNKSVSLQLPYATGGNGDLQYSFSDAAQLPPTLDYAPATNRIVGVAPGSPVGEQTFTLTATDADGDTATFTLRLTIDTNTVPDFADTLLRRVYATGQTVELKLPSAQGGNGTVVYSLSNQSQLPSGLAYTASTSTIAGVAPGSPVAERSFTLTATDADGDLDTLDVRIEIATDTAPSFDVTEVVREFGTNKSVSLSLPSASGGNGTVSYSLSNVSNLPTNLTYSAATNAISGVASGSPVAERSFTLTASDADGDTATIPVKITIATDSSPSFGATTEVVREFGTSKSVSLSLPSATGGNGTVAYSLSNVSNLPSNLAYSATGNSITGLASGVPVAERSFTLTATDHDGDTATLTVKITIATDSSPSFGATTEIVREYGTGKSVTLSLPNATGGNGTVSYSLSNVSQLPGSLDYSASGNAISGGTGSSALAERSFTLTATDHDGDTATLTVKITVATNSSPSFGSTTEVVREFGTGRTISLSLPTASGGNGTVSYSLSNVSQLPGTLEYSATGNSIAGATLLSAVAERSFTLTATDHDGDTATLTVKIGIATNSSPSFGVTTEVVREYGTSKSVSLSLPTATGGNGTVSYSLSNSDRLPGTLDYSGTGNSIAGTTPSSAVAERSFTLTATDSDGDTATLTVKLTVATNSSPSFGGVTEVVREYGTSRSVSLSLPTATGGNGTVSYSLSNVSQLPGTLEYSATGNSIAGTTPGSAVAERSFTLTATDSDGDTATLTVKLTVTANSSPSFGATTEVVREYGTSKSVTLSLPTATGGNGTVSYSLSNASNLPGNLAFSASGNSITGLAPGSPVAQQSFTLTATDHDGDTATLTVKITIATNSSPSFGAVTEVVREYGAAKTVTLSLPSATGGNGTVSYSLSNASNLPGTLAFSATGNAIAGTTPSSAVAERSFTLTATDSDGDTATLTVKITIATNSSPSFGAVTEVVREFGTGKSVTLALPNATGGNGTVSYSLSNASNLPGTLAFSAAGNSITGLAPASPVAERSFTLTATDSDGDTATLTVKVTVATDSSPSFGAVTEVVREYGTGKSVSLSLPAVSGGNGTLAYSLSNESQLPGTLVYSAGTNMISGTAPASAVAERSFTLTVTDHDGDTATFTVRITIAADSSPSFSATEVVRELGTGRSVLLILPTVSGGNGTATYSLSNLSQLPGTLQYSASTNSLSGATPSSAVAQRSFTLTATDNDGDTTTMTVKISVADNSTPSFARTRIDYLFATSEAVDRPLPGASGGNGTVTYTLTGESQLPQNLAFSAALNKISGTASATPVAQRTFTLTATDDDGETATLVVTVAVVTPVDYDTDDDGLIEVKDLAQLNAIRWDLNGDGQVSDGDRLDYVLAFGAAKPRMGCNEDISQPSEQVCEGYELTANLDFDSDNDGDVDADDHQGLYWNNGAGWRPIGPYEAIFDGNRRSISGLFINITGSRPVANAGLFSEISGTAEVRYLSVNDVSITVERNRSSVGAVVGVNRGKVRFASSSGEITAGATATASDSSLGGLIGWQDQVGTVTPSVFGAYSSVDVTGGSYSGGLVGRNSSAKIARSYATGAVRTNGVANDRYLGGLVGYVWGGNSAVSESYATGSVADTRTRGFVSVGGIVGVHDDGRLTEGYATGSVSGTNSGSSRNFGGLVGRGEASTTDADVYWDSQTTTAGSRGIGFTYSSTTFNAKGLTTAELQADTNQTVAAAGYDGVYKDWDHSIWDFGSTSQYPVLVVDFNGDGTATWQEFGTQRTTSASTANRPSATRAWW